jgi:hypothetical protein
MIVGNDIGLYLKNTLGGYFLDWELSQVYFKDPGSYESIIMINEAFAEDPPDVIVDEMKLMEQVLDRLPRVKKLYRKEGDVYWRL